MTDQIPATHIVEYTTTNGEELVYRVDEDSLPGVYFEKYENGVGKIYFTKAVTSIVDRAFADSQNLRSVTFPKSVTHIGSRALANVVSLTDVYMQSPSVPSLASDAGVLKYTFRTVALQPIWQAVGPTKISEE